MLNKNIAVKQQLYHLCLEYIEQRIGAASDAIINARQAAEGETKSSAGDKYETSREMMQHEIERNTLQLNEARKLKNALSLIKPDAAPTTAAGAGSLVMTDNGNFYLAIGAGTFTVDDTAYFAISPASPIGIKLRGLHTGNEFELNQKHYSITAIY